MEIKGKLFDDLEFGVVYYLHYKINGGRLIFGTAKDYQVFLTEMKDRLLPIADIYAYSLLPSAFQFLLCFKSKNEIHQQLDLPETEYSLQTMNNFLMKHCSDWLKSFVEKTQKEFSLPMEIVRRTRVEEETDLLEILKQIHLKPIQNALVKHAEDWKYSSYVGYLNLDKPSSLNRNFMLSFFPSQQEFLDFHKQ